MMRRSLSTNLIVSAALAIVAVIALVFGLWTALMTIDPTWLRQRDLAGTADHVVEALRFDADDRPVSVELSRNMQRVVEALPADYFYQVLDERGAVLLSSNGSRDSLFSLDSPLPLSRQTLERQRNGLALRALVVPVQRPKRLTYVVTARSARFDDALLEEAASLTRMTALVASSLALTLFGAVVFITLRRMLRRLRDISDAAARIEPSNFTARLEIQGVPAEITPLIQSFNAALARLERGYRVQQEFLATAAHELKTPLALMRGQIEVEGASDTGALLKDLDHMGRQVHQLLHLAEVSEASNFSLEPLDAAPVVAEAIEFLSRLTQSRRVTVNLQRPPAPVTVVADRGALFVLMRNLVENAVHHTPEHSTIKVAVDWDGITVRDQGKGIAPEDLPHLFKRFWRGPGRRDEGAGLGLSICDEIVRAHGWTLSATNAPGHGPAGAQFQICFRSTAGGV